MMLKTCTFQPYSDSHGHLELTGNNLLRDCQDAHEDVKVSSTREHWNQKHLAKAIGMPPLEPPCNEGARLLTFALSVFVQSIAPATSMQPRLPRTANCVPCRGTEHNASLWTQPRCSWVKYLCHPLSAVVSHSEPLVRARAWKA
jgi:hypothetical protein